MDINITWLKCSYGLQTSTILVLGAGIRLAEWGNEHLLPITMTNTTRSPHIHCSSRKHLHHVGFGQGICLMPRHKSCSSCLVKECVLCCHSSMNSLYFCIGVFWSLLNLAASCYCSYYPELSCLFRKYQMNVHPTDSLSYIGGDKVRSFNIHAVFVTIPLNHIFQI
jgi:hypothetical protein